MSASLVGSEMCIRDRSSSNALTTKCAGACSLVLVNCSGTESRGPGAASSVSYTHLTLPTICSV
eukprot:2881616-Alexandrium_andersonii.AAC.1